MSVLSFDAPAKINIHLAAGGRRQDGFHAIQSIFVPVSLCDSICFELLPAKNSAPDISISMDLSALPAAEAAPLAALDVKKNLVFKAVTLFCTKTGWNCDAHIQIIKRIPAGAGLGGGSSDCAAALCALNQASPYKAELAALAAELGSDVPFFLQNGASFVEGRGEMVRPLFADIAAFSVVIVKPDFSSDTARAYQLLDTAYPDRKSLVDAEILTGAFLVMPPCRWHFSNDFLTAFLRHGTTAECSAYTAILHTLKEYGADFVNLSGSGSACFGIFQDSTAAGRAAAALGKDWPFVRETCFKTSQMREVS